MRTDLRTKLLLGTAGCAAFATMAVLGLETAQAPAAPEISMPAAQATMRVGETVTQSAAPSAPETPAATPPVKAQPAPTAEPG